MALKPLTDYPLMLEYCDLSPTFKTLYDYCVSLGITLGDADDYQEEVHPEHMPDICIQGANLWEGCMSPNDAVCLAHEMRHAMQEIPDPVEGEKDAYKWQGVVREELIAANCVVTEWVPLTDAEVDEVYVPFYAGETETV